MQCGISGTGALQSGRIIVGGFLLINRTSNQLLVIDYAGNNRHIWCVRCCRWRIATIAIAIAITVATTIAVTVTVAVAITVSGVVIAPTAATSTAATCGKANSASNRDPAKNPRPDGAAFMASLGSH